MKPDLHNNPIVPQGWLRAVLFVVFYFGCLLIAGFFLLYSHKPPVDIKDIAKGNTPYLLLITNALISLAAVWLFRKVIDRKSFESIGFSIDKNGNHAGSGFFLGILLLCAGTCILYFSKNLVWTDISFSGNDLFISFGLMVIVAFYEEMVFRGYILNNLLESANKWLALCISALVFTLGHLANPDFSVVAAGNIFLAGILLGLNYIYTRNLWFGMMLHFSWNFFQGPILGYEVSGLHLQSLFQHDIQGSVLLTGGKFGFEGSLVASALCLLAIVALIWLYEKKYAFVHALSPVSDNTVV
ncbi:MAG: CPBP family intramembrane glutamic endopeptidase [Bacteroidota bacterium]